MITSATAALAATQYESAKRTIKTAKAEKDNGKKTLLEWLGDEVSRKLPDGRVISKVSTPFEAATIERKAYVAVSLTIQHPIPAAALPRRRAAGAG